MSSRKLPACAFDLRTGFLALVASIAAGCGSLVALWLAVLPAVAWVTGAVAVTGLLLWTFGPQYFGAPGSRPVRLLFAEDAWQLQLGDGRRVGVTFGRFTAQLGRAWFLHWRGGWAVVTPLGLTERDWRRFTCRLRECSRAAAAGSASRIG